MAASLVLVTVITVLLTNVSGQKNNQFETIFKVPLNNNLKNFPLQNIEFDPWSNNFFVSGKNVLYRLSLDGNMAVSKQIRPGSDCFPNDDTLKEKYCKDDYNYVMVVTQDSLITCSTLYGGRCVRRNKMSWNDTSAGKTIQLMSETGASAVGIFLNVSVKRSDSKTENKTVLLFAKSSIDLPTLSKLEKSVIFSVLPNLTTKGFSSSVTEDGIFDIFLMKTGFVKMDYRVAIENEDFVFLLVNQNSQAKLVKICKSIDGVNPKKVYEDIPISCSGKDGTNYTRVVHGTFVSASSTRFLVALFTNSMGSSATCVYSEEDIYQAYLESRINRYGCPEKHDLPTEQLIFEGVKNVATCTNISNREIVGVYEAFHNGAFCNIVTSGAPRFGIIIGLLPLQGNALYTTSHLVTVVEGLVINELVTLYIGTAKGLIIKVFLDTSNSSNLSTIELETMNVPQDKSELRAVKNVQGEIYAMSQNKIVKLHQERNCAQYSQNCTVCMGAKDAHCGWCITQNSCTLKADCTNQMRTSYWLPSVKKQCLDLRFESDLMEKAIALDSGLKNNISVRFIPKIEFLQNMSCILNGTKLSSYVGTDDIKCGIDLSTQVVRFSEGFALLEIILNAVPIASRNVLFYRCAAFKSCGKCIGNDITSCYWCKEEAKCARARGDCDTKPGVSEINSCPQINNQMVKIPSDRTRDLEFQGNNLMKNFQYRCIVEGTTYKGEVISSGENSLRCKDVKIPGEGDKKVMFKYGPNATVDLESFSGTPTVSVYKCQTLSPNKQDCSTCLYLNQSSSEGYECHWCKTAGCVDIDDTRCSDSEMCSKPVVTKVDPSDGPTGGGTVVVIDGYNFGIRNDVTITVADEPCENVERKGRRLTCTTAATKSGTPKNGPVQITIDGQTSEENVLFAYKDPNITGIIPNRTILSGGRTVILTGTDLNIGNMNYKVEMISTAEGSEDMKSTCKIIMPKSVDGKIACKPSKAEKIGSYTLKVTFDNNTMREVKGQLFTYLDDPEIDKFGLTDLKSINSGGTPFSVTGKGFVSVIENKYVGIEGSTEDSDRSACRIISLSELECYFPRIKEINNRRRKRATNTAIVIHLDGFSYNIPNVVYVDDPLFMAFYGNSTYTFDPTEHESITLRGKNLATVAKKKDYSVFVGSGECAITSLNSSELICRPPSKEPSPRFTEDKLYITVEVGNAKQIVGNIEYVSEFPITIIIIVVLAVILIAFTIGAVLGVRRVRARNQLKIAEIMTEMQDIEQNTMRMHQEEFAEMQLNITDIKRDLVSTGIPYHSFQNYAQYILFPKEVEAGTVNGLMQHSGFSSTNVQKAMDQFDKLMSNKYFVKSLIGTLEKQRKITLIDKAQFSANFSVVMMGKMRDFFEIVNCLLSTLVDASNKKQHKTLFNRFESITLRLLSHWLSVSLYPYLKEGGGSSLFMLYKSTQAVVEKRPVDEVTGEAKNTLSEENFLREKIDCHTLKLEIDLNANGNLYTCEVLDCDTINQVKSKCLYQIYKNKPASEMPTIDEVDLEWLAGKSGRLTLSNIDQTSEREDGMVRLNTLQHYNVMDGSRMALLYKFTPDDEDPYENQRSPSDVEITIPPDVHLIQSVSTTGSIEDLRRWHLVKNLEEEDSHEKHLKPKDMVKTSHITNLMHTKLVLQDNIKEVFDSVLNHETVPLVVHYLFGVLENLADENGVEPETLLCWKSESYAMRVWATLLVRPEFLFDIQKVKHVEPCLNVIKQVFIDCFHSTKISKDSSLQKLLFAQEVPHYQKRTEQFYKALGNKAAVTDADFWNEMTKLNALQQEHLKFSKPAALQKLYKFVQQYMEEIIEDLDEGPETSGLQFGKKLDDIFRQMETDS